jgi:hypothetical protein
VSKISTIRFGVVSWKTSTKPRLLPPESVVQLTSQERLVGIFWVPLMTVTALAVFVAVSIRMIRVSATPTILEQPTNTKR